MTDEQKPKIQDLAQPEQELTPEQAAAAEGGSFLDDNWGFRPTSPTTSTPQAKPTIEIG